MEVNLVSGISLTLFWRSNRVVIDIRVYITAVGRDIRFGNIALLTLGKFAEFLAKHVNRAFVTTPKGYRTNEQVLASRWLNGRVCRKSGLQFLRTLIATIDQTTAGSAKRIHQNGAGQAQSQLGEIIRRFDAVTNSASRSCRPLLLDTRALAVGRYLMLHRHSAAEPKSCHPVLEFVWPRGTLVGPLFALYVGERCRKIRSQHSHRETEVCQPHCRRNRIPIESHVIRDLLLALRRDECLRRAPYSPLWPRPNSNGPNRIRGRQEADQTDSAGGPAMPELGIWEGALEWSNKDSRWCLRSNRSRTGPQGWPGPKRNDSCFQDVVRGVGYLRRQEFPSPCGRNDCFHKEIYHPQAAIWFGRRGTPE